MGRLRALAVGLTGLLLAADVVMAQDTTAPAKPAAPVQSSTPPSSVPTTIVVVPASANTPAIKVPTNALIPAEGTPPKAEALKPTLKAETPPPDPKPDVPPIKRPRFTAAVIQGVDKITAETLRFEAKVGEPVRYKGLILTVHACETTAADEDVQDSIVHLDVVSQPISAGHASGPVRQVFRGWMFAGGPALHPFENSIYDLWLIACKTASPKA